MKNLLLICITMDLDEGMYPEVAQLKKSDSLIQEMDTYEDIFEIQARGYGYGFGVGSKHGCEYSPRTTLHLEGTFI